MAFSEYHRLRVLVLDDFDGFRSTVTRMLESFGVPQVDTASNAADAFALCEKERYHAILADYSLGKGQTGLQLLEALRFYGLIDNNQIFVLVSAENSKQIVLAASDVEPDAYLSKPITAKNLHHRLDRILIQRSQLKPLFAALDRAQTSRAIALCRDHIKQRGHQAGFCQKLLGQLLIEERAWREAEQVYRSVLQVRPLEWAKIGMAQVKQLAGELTTAERWFRDLTQSNPMCLKAYDGLAEVYQALHDDRNLQAVLEQAVEISPLALLRQQSLAYAARANHDYTVAVKSFRRVIRLAEFSVYRSPQQSLDYARTALVLDANNLQSDYCRDATEKLALIAVPAQPTDVRVQSLLLQTQLCSRQQDLTQAKQHFRNAEKLLAEGAEAVPSFAVQLERVHALRSVGQAEASEQMLAQLCEQCQHDEDKLQRLDGLLAEPRSNKNRKLIAQINKEGIRQYQAHHFSEAIACFVRAQVIFPKHIGVRLNLAQALLEEMNQFGCQDDLVDQADAALGFVAQAIKPNDAQYRRFIKLKELRQSLARGNV